MRSANHVTITYGGPEENPKPEVSTISKAMLPSCFAQRSVVTSTRISRLGAAQTHEKQVRVVGNEGGLSVRRGAQVTVRACSMKAHACGRRAPVREESERRADTHARHVRCRHASYVCLRRAPVTKHAGCGVRSSSRRLRSQLGQPLALPVVSTHHHLLSPPCVV